MRTQEPGDAAAPAAPEGSGTAFAAALRRHRRAAGLTQEALAERAGVGVRTLQGLERGEAHPLRATARRLAEGLGLPATARAPFLAAAAPSPRVARAPGSLRGGLRLVPPSAMRPGPAPPGNLPAELSSFVGREAEGAEVARRVAAHRLVTLTGPGGVGKTRLALRVAAALRPAYPDGVWLVDLAALTDPTLVPRAAAAAVGVRAHPARPVADALADALRPRRLLLVLDNCEHLLDACARLADALLRACPGLRLLTTSRESLGLTGEAVWRVPPLPAPPAPPATGAPAVPDVDGLERYAAVRLFCERAVAVQPGFALTAENGAAVAQVCARLDGIPLALELAAARVRALSPAQLLDRMADRFRLLTGGSRTALPRHQTLRAAVEWSYGLLDDDERGLFGRLAVFVGGCTLEAAEATEAGSGAAPAGEAGGPPAGAAARSVVDGLVSLVDKSLLRQEPQPDGEPRFGMLETIRAYALERLAAGPDAAGAGRAHARYYLALAERAEPELRRAQQVAWLDRLEREHGNLRAALRWWQQTGDAERGLRLAGALWLFWRTRGHVAEGRAWLAALLAAPETSGTPGAAASTRAKALFAAGVLAAHAGDFPAGRALHAEALTLRRALGDGPAVADSLGSFALVAFAQGERALARAALDEALPLARAAADRRLTGRLLRELAQLLTAQGDYLAARPLIEESVGLERQVGNRAGLGQSLYAFGRLLRPLGADAAARAAFRESLTIRRELGDATAATLDLRQLAVLDAADHPERALRLAGAVAGLREAGIVHALREEDDGLAPVVERARQRLGEDVAAVAWAKGRAMSLEQAVAHALDEVPDAPDPA